MSNQRVRSACFKFLMFTTIMLGLSAASLAQYGYGQYGNGQYGNDPYGNGQYGDDQYGSSVDYAPPPLPIYDQPPLPEEGYIWAPGYWAFDRDYNDYYWVPGTWVQPPEQGYLWTPGYWGWNGNGYRYNEGYWGPQVGYYGGIDYGHGYYGQGYDGGRWQNGRFYYNRSVNRFDRDDFPYVYDEAPRHRDREDRTSYNGGQGGINVRPTPEEEAAAHQKHIPRIAAQTQNIQAARKDPELRASANHGKPPVAATAKPADFHTRAVPAKQAGGAYNPPPNRPANRPNANAGDRDNSQPDATSVRRRDNERSNPPADNGNAGRVARPNEAPERERSNAPEATTPRQDPRVQQQQREREQQDNERPKPPQKSDEDKQRMDQQKPEHPRGQQMEERREPQKAEQQQEPKTQARPEPKAEPHAKPKPTPPNAPQEDQPH
jgi:hypothetical protein